MELYQIGYHPNSARQKDKVEAALNKLKELRNKTAEIRTRCELLREMEAACQMETIVCSECGKGIEQNQKITLMDSSRNPKSYYHRDCLKAIWVSQNWKFDFSSPGFLRKSERSC